MDGCESCARLRSEEAEAQDRIRQLRRREAALREHPPSPDERAVLEELRRDIQREQEGLQVTLKHQGIHQRTHRHAADDGVAPVPSASTESALTPTDAGPGRLRPFTVTLTVVVVVVGVAFVLLLAGSGSGREGSDSAAGSSTTSTTSRVADDQRSPPPWAGSLRAVLVVPNTTYAVTTGDDIDDDELVYDWSETRVSCGSFRGDGPAAVWSHPNEPGGCTHDADAHPGTIVVVVTHARGEGFRCTYTGGSASGDDATCREIQ